MRTAPKVSPVTTERCSPFLLLHAPQAHPAAGTKDAEMRGMSLGFLFASPRRVGGCREIEERRGAEERPGSPRALRTFGGMGGPSRPPVSLVGLQARNRLDRAAERLPHPPHVPARRVGHQHPPPRAAQPPPARLP